MHDEERHARRDSERLTVVKSASKHRSYPLGALCSYSMLRARCSLLTPDPDCLLLIAHFSLLILAQSSLLEEFLGAQSFLDLVAQSSLLIAQPQRQIPSAHFSNISSLSTQCSLPNSPHFMLVTHYSLLAARCSMLNDFITPPPPREIAPAFSAPGRLTLFVALIHRLNPRASCYSIDFYSSSLFTTQSQWCVQSQRRTLTPV